MTTCTKGLPRTIVAGSLIWINFDRHALLALVHKLGGPTSPTSMTSVPSSRPTRTSSCRRTRSSTRPWSAPTGCRPMPPSTSSAASASTPSRASRPKPRPWYSDQILPFDITLAGTNENGAATCMKIFGVEILNEGSGISIDDAVTEMQATFVARYVEPWKVMNSPLLGWR